MEDKGAVEDDDEETEDGSVCWSVAMFEFELSAGPPPAAASEEETPMAAPHASKFSSMHIRPSYNGRDKSPAIVGCCGSSGKGDVRHDGINKHMGGADADADEGHGREEKSKGLN